MKQIRSDSLAPFPLYCFGPLAAAVIPAAISAASSLASNAANFFSQKSTNRKQMELAAEANDYQKQLNERIMQREDTAYQRAVADAQAAGLSPLVTAGTGGAGAGGTVSGNMNVPQLSAPQLDPNMFQDAIRSFQQSAMQQRQIDAQNKSQDKQLSFETTKLQATLDAQNQMLDKQLEAASQSQDKELADRQAARIEQSRQFNAQLSFLIDSKNQDYILEMQKDAIRSASELGIKKLNFVHDVEALQAGYDRFADAYTQAGSRVMSEYYRDHGFGADQVTETTSGANSSSSGVSSGFSGSASAGGSGSGSGAGASGHLGAEYSDNESQSISVNKTSNVYEKMRKAQADAGNLAGFPVLIPMVKKRD